MLAKSIHVSLFWGSAVSRAWMIAIALRYSSARRKAHAKAIGIEKLHKEPSVNLGKTRREGSGL